MTPDAPFPNRPRNRLFLAALVVAGGCMLRGPAPKPADNSYCYVCHINYRGEKLTLNHERAGVGCEECHGESDRHSADEDGLTPPEIMFPKARIAPACMACHPTSRLAREKAHKLMLADAAGSAACTECHGKHRLAVRTRRWDKATGKLLADDGVRMMQENSPAGSAR